MKEKRVLGDKTQFAVEYEVTQSFGPYLYGNMCYWIKGVQIGDYNQEATLSDMFWDIQHLVGDNGKRAHTELFGLKTEELFYRLNSTLFGKGNKQYNKIGEEETWARFNICINIDIFYAYKIFMVEQGDKARIVFSDQNEILHGYYIQKGIVDEVFEQLYDEFNKIYDQCTT